MKLLWLLLVSSAVALLPAALAAADEYKNEEEEDDDFIPYNGQRYDKFDWQLCSALDHREPGNVIASTLSVKLLLSMIYQGSDGETKRQLETILQLATSKDLTAAKASVLLKSLKVKSPYYEVELGSKIYLDTKLEAKHWYQRRLRSYDTFVDTIDFTNPTQATHVINTWVETVTRGKIRDLINDPDMVRDTVMLLVNAVYFKGKWSYPFDPQNTQRGLFLSAKGSDEVQYMSQTKYFYYTWSEELASQIIRLPYKGKRFGMYIVLPENPKGLDNLLMTIKPFTLRRSIWELEQVMVEVILPKFKIEYSADLKSLLQKIGISTIFDSDNDIIGIKKRKAMKTVVTNVIQKAMIEVDEEGTRAAVASGVIFGNKFGGGGVVFNASHPFLFFIEDEKTGTVVFIGKLVNPRDSAMALPHHEEHYGPTKPPPPVYNTKPKYSTPKYITTQYSTPKYNPPLPLNHHMPETPMVAVDEDAVVPVDYRTTKPPPYKPPVLPQPSYPRPISSVNPTKNPYQNTYNQHSFKPRGSIEEMDTETTPSPPLMNHIDRRRRAK